MMLLDRSKVAHKDGKTIVGDTIFYDKIKNYGESFGNVEMVDSVKKNTLYGDYVYYNENTETGILILPLYSVVKRYPILLAFSR